MVCVKLRKPEEVKAYWKYVCGSVKYTYIRIIKHHDKKITTFREKAIISLLDSIWTRGIANAQHFFAPIHLCIYRRYCELNSTPQLIWIGNTNTAINRNSCRIVNYQNSTRRELGRICWLYICVCVVYYAAW